MATTSERQADLNGTNSASEAQGRAAPHARVLIVDADPALFGLLQEWLGECGCAAVEERAGAPRNPGNDDRFDLVVVDVPFPRQGGVERVTRVANEHPGAPILALSSCFFAGIACKGAVARSLGVASVLPKPVSRETLVSAVRNLIPSAK